MAAAARRRPPPPSTPTGIGGAFRLLHQRFILAQLLMGATNAAVRTMLEREDLDDVDDAALKRLRGGLAPPKKFNVRNQKHQPSLGYLDQVGIRELLHRTPEAEQALDILRNPRAREIIEVGLIVQAPLGALVAHLQKEKLSVGTTSIELFERLFWSVRAFDRAALRGLLELRAMRRALRGASGEEERRVALRATRSDARVLAASLPRSPTTWVLALGSLGHPPTKLPLDKVLEQLRDYAALRATESVLRGAPGDEARAASFVAVLRNATELHQTVVPPDVALQEGLRSMRLRTEASRLPMIHDISGGCHTVDIQGHDKDADDVVADPDEATGS